MKLFLSVFLFSSFYLFASNGKIDTLEIFVLYTQFKEELHDNQLTTGSGLFDSDSNSEYTLDPRGYRQYRFYLEYHLEFVKQYYKQVSRGQLEIKWQFFPSPNVSTGKIDKPIQLSQTMSFYSPSRFSGQNGEAFNTLKELQYISFISETLRLAASLERSPFNVPRPSSNTLRSYLIFHAGHSRLTDRSTLGVGGDTPNDLLDIFIDQNDFQILKEIENDTIDILLPQKKDSLGIVISDNQIITQVMVLSESASQDGINFGINGILINQIARQIGMPDVWNQENGFPQVGFFDLMDFGQLAGTGFFPVYPSAWHRIFMGWEKSKMAYPEEDGETTYPISTVATLVDGQTSILKIPLNGQEYLLAENRQKSKSDSVIIYFSFPENENDPRFSRSDSVRISVDFIDSLLLDSLCNFSNKCQKNTKRPKGIITGVSDYDMFLPGSGLLVWKVHQRVIQKNLSKGFVNNTNNRVSEGLGIQLVEADGNRSLTAIGRDELGLDVVDFGSGADFLPHIVFKLEGSRVSKVDTITQISANHFVNTQSFHQGRTHISLSTKFPIDRILTKSRSFNGDSILTVLDSILPLTVHWNTNTNLQRVSYSKWPVFSLPSSGFFNHSILNLEDTLLIHTTSNEGFLQFYNLNGFSVSDVVDTAVTTSSLNSNHNDSLFIYGLENHLGEIKSNAIVQDSILILVGQENKIYRVNINQQNLPSSESFLLDSLIETPQTQILIYDDLIWFSTKNQLLAYDLNFQPVRQISIPNQHYQDQALISLKDDQWGIVLVDSLAQLIVVNLQTQRVRSIINTQNLPFLNEKFSLQTSDFDRNGEEEILLLGSFGSMTMKSLNGETMAGFPLFITRSDSIVGNSITTIFDDPTPASLGDINDDGLVDIIVTVPNGIQVLSYRGEKLWLFLTDQKQGHQFPTNSLKISSKLILSTPLIVYMNREGNREPVILISSPNGLIWAIDGEGRALIDNHAVITEKDKSFPAAFASDWPLSVGGMGEDTNYSSSVQISVFEYRSKHYLLGQTSLGGSYLWNIANLHTNQKGSWRYFKGGQKRQSRFDSKLLLKELKVTELQNTIQTFYLYPSPLSKRTKPVVRLNIQAPAQNLKLRIFDLSGSEVFSQNLGSAPFAGQHDFPVSLNHLGVDVYLAVIEVQFLNGERKKAYQRFGVVH